MIDREYVRYMVGEKTFAKGIRIYAGDKILSFDVDPGPMGDYVQAEVEGSHGAVYHVKMEYDYEKDDVEYIECSCPAYANDDGICKHCTAVLLEYLDYCENTEMVLPFSAGNVFLQRRPKKPQTTPEFKQLLSGMVAKKVLPITSGDIFGKVKIEPHAECSEEGISIRFKLGVSRMYVVKDLFAFAKHIENKENYAYGKNLQFVHMQDAFAPQYRDIVTFICRWAKKNRYNYRYVTYAGYYRDEAKSKQMDLTAGELEEFLDILPGSEIFVNVRGEGETLWERTEEPLLRHMEIEGEDTGLHLHVEKFFGYTGENSYIYFENGKIHRIPKEEMEPIGEFVQCLASIPDGKIFVEKEDVPLFCREMLPKLERFYECKKIRFDESDYGMIPVVFRIYLDAPRKDFVTCRLMAVYDGKEYNVYDKTKDEGRRDLAEEARMTNLLSACFPEYDEKNGRMILSGDDERIYRLLTEEIQAFHKIGEVFISDALKKIRITRPPKVAVGVSLSGNLLELSIHADGMSRNMLAEILSKYDRKKKFYRMKNGSFLDFGDNDFGRLKDLQEGLRLTAGQLKADVAEVPKYRALYIDAQMKEKSGISFERDKGFKKLIREMKTVEDNDFEIPVTLKGVLRDYQKTGFLWLKTLKQNGFGGILADDMGLGKTLQVITLLLSEWEDGDVKYPSMIVTPASLVFNWKYELESFAPELSVRVITGNAKERQKAIQEIRQGEVVITSYDLLKRDIDDYADKRFECQIIDEAQYIKNHNTQAARAVKDIAAGCKIALTGTPVENRLSELWSIFDYLMPGFLYSYQKFKKDIEQPIVQEQDEAAMERLKKMIAPFVLRRLKKDVLKDLPDKLEKVMYTSLEGEQEKLYDAHVQRLRMMLDGQTKKEFQTSKIQVLAELTKLRQICCNPALIFEKYAGNSSKTDACLALLESAVSGGHKVLLFSQFVSSFEYLCKGMEKKGIHYLTLTGKDSKEKRREMVEKFQQGDIPVFCISLKAGGTGLNLTAADVVIHYDPWWNVAVQNQATDRAHRIGQENKVIVYRMIMKDTIEEKIIRLQEKKQELADRVLAGEDIGSGSFSREEILELLQ